MISCVAVTARAQETPLLPGRPEPTPHPFGQLRMGTWAFTPLFRITNIGLDTNVFDLSGTERLPADFTATIEPGVEARMTTSRVDARAATRTAFVYYQKYGTERAVNPMVDVTIQDQLSSRMALYMNGNYGYSKERTGFEIDSRPRTLSQSTRAGVKVGGRKLQLDLHGRFEKVGYDRNAQFLDVNLSQQLDHRSYGGGAAMNYRLSPYTTLTAGGDATFERFAFAADRDANATSGFVGLRFSPRAMIGGDATIGYTRVDPRDPRVPSFSGITPSAGLSYRLGEMFVASFGGQRGTKNSFYGDRPYYVYTLYEGSVRQALYHHFDIGGSLQYTTVEYRRFLDAERPAEAPRDVVRMATVSLGIPVTHQIRFGIFGQQWERISDERPYKTTRAGIEMTVGRATLSPRGVFLSGPTR